MLALALAGAGCARGGPEETVVRFHRLLARGDGEKALALLSKATREELARRAKAAHEAGGGVLEDDPAAMIVAGDSAAWRGPDPSKPGEVSLVERDATRAVVRARIGEDFHEVRLVRESGRWLIDLQLSPPGPPPSPPPAPAGPPAPAPADAPPAPAPPAPPG